jgi:hypothetical protein
MPGVFVDNHGELMMSAYLSLFSAFVILGELKAFATNRVLSKAYLVIGSLGIMAFLSH